MVKKLSLLLLVCAPMYSKILLWDLGGELFHPNKLGVAREIGLRHFISYTLFDWKSPNIQKLIFDVLDLLEKPGEKHLKGAATAEETPLPLVMCKWQAGTLLGPDIIKMARPHVKQLYKQKYFNSKREARLVMKTISAMFDPALLARNIQPVKAGIKLLQECVDERDSQGKPKHRNIAFSNMDPLSYKLFSKANAGILNKFEDIIISGDIGLIKPHKEAFEYVIKRCNLHPADCLLIDDQKTNADGAKKCGIRTLLLKNYNYAALRKELVLHGILS